MRLSFFWNVKRRWLVVRYRRSARSIGDRLTEPRSVGDRLTEPRSVGDRLTEPRSVGDRLTEPRSRNASNQPQNYAMCHSRWAKASSTVFLNLISHLVDNFPVVISHHGYNLWVQTIERSLWYYYLPHVVPYFIFNP